MSVIIGTGINESDVIIAKMFPSDIQVTVVRNTTVLLQLISANQFDKILLSQLICYDGENIRDVLASVKGLQPEAKIACYIGFPTLEEREFCKLNDILVYTIGLSEQDVKVFINLK